jgi:hypothetical protein
MSPDLFEEDTGPAPRRNGFGRGTDTRPGASAMQQVLYAIYSRQSQAASVTAADLQVAERHGGDCEEVVSFAVPPTSDDQSILPSGETEPVLSGTADTLESMVWHWGILLADEESSAGRLWFAGIRAPALRGRYICTESQY